MIPSGEAHSYYGTVLEAITPVKVKIRSWFIDPFLGLGGSNLQTYLLSLGTNLMQIFIWLGQIVPVLSKFTFKETLSSRPEKSSFSKFFDLQITSSPLFMNRF